MAPVIQPFVWIVTFANDAKTHVQPVAFEQKDEAAAFAQAEGERLGVRTFVRRAVNQSEVNRRIAAMRMLDSLGTAVQEAIARAPS